MKEYKQLRKLTALFLINAARSNTTPALCLGLSLTIVAILTIQAIGPGLTNGTNFHTVLEFSMTIFAAMVGGMSLIRYYTRKQRLFLYLGIGFIGTAILDAYIALATTATFLHFIPSEFNTFFAWGWTSRGLFLAFFLAVYFISNIGGQKSQPIGKFFEISIFLLAGIFVLAFYSSFSIITLPEIILQINGLNHVEDFIPGVIYGLMFIGLISGGDWREENFEFWFIISLALLTAAHTLFMPYSVEPYDASFMTAHIVKLSAYLVVLLSLLSNVYGVYNTARHSESRIRAIVESSIDGLITVDWNGEITSFNSAAENIFKMSINSIRGDSIRDLITAQNQSEFDGFWQNVQQNLAEEAKETSEFIGIDHEKNLFNLEFGVTKLPDSQHGEGYLIRARDITERKTSEQTIYRQANFDALTNLPNRMLFNDRLANEISRTKREGTQVALMFLDLDGFKKINDTMGHSAGDQLLITAGERIIDSVREVDTVARLGGDEFTIILPNIHKRHDSEIVAQKIIKNLTQPYLIDGMEVVVTGSIGITLFPKDAQDQESIVKNADAAMYKAKAAGKNVYRFFTPEMNEEALKALKIENGIREALRKEQFELYYQPIIDAKSETIIGAEALIRWIHPEQGLIPPDDFIPICEETGAIHEVGEWVINEACKQLRKWKDMGFGDFYVAVNLSPQQIWEKLFDDVIANALNAHGLAPDAIVLEITESTFIDDQKEKVIAAISEKGDLSPRFCLDDFGTGYSSLGALKRFKIEILKIDRSFIQKIDQSDADVAMVTAIVVMSKALNIPVVCEGVETIEQLNLIRQIGADYVQGYYYSRPIPANDFEQLLLAPTEKRLAIS
jgi:diguanylate cyclase (GGDEF)-like protein/PAS domain S-box-containing protein